MTQRDGIGRFMLGDIPVWVDDRMERMDLDAALSSVSAQRRETAMRFRHDAGRRQSVAVYRLLQMALHEQYGIDVAPELVTGPHGKPSLAGLEHIHFNMSHCREAAVCAVGDRPVGVDVECIERTVNQSLITHTMNDDERRLIADSDDPAAEFIALWTAKESVLKLHGYGLVNDLHDVLTGPLTQGVSLYSHRNHRYIITIAYKTDVNMAPPQSGSPTPS